MQTPSFLVQNTRDAQRGITTKQKEIPKNQNSQNPLGDQLPTTNYDLHKNQYCKAVWGGGTHKSHCVTYYRSAICKRQEAIIVTEEAPAGVWGIALGGSVEKLERISKKAT